MVRVHVQELVECRYGVDGEVPVCTRCSALVSPLEHYCAECGAPQGFATSIPYVYIWATADFFVRLVDILTGRRSMRGIVLLGLLFVEGASMILLLTPVALLVWLWLRGRRTEGSD